MSPLPVVPYADRSSRGGRLPYITLFGSTLAIASWVVRYGQLDFGGNKDLDPFRWGGIGFAALVITSIGFAIERRTARPTMTVIVFAVGVALAILPTFVFCFVFLFFVILAR